MDIHVIESAMRSHILGNLGIAVVVFFILESSQVASGGHVTNAVFQWRRQQ